MSVIFTGTNQPAVDDSIEAVVTAVLRIVHPWLTAYLWDDKEFLVLCHKADPRAKTDEDKNKLVIVAKSIDITDNNGILVFSQDLEKLPAPTLRMVAKNFGCHNVGFLTKFQVRHQMALKKTMKTNYSINDATSTTNATKIQKIISELLTLVFIQITWSCS
jgi:hypothetical protein